MNKINVNYNIIFKLTYHAGSDSNGDQVLKFGHIPPGLLVEGVDEVTNPRQEGNQQKNLQISHQSIYSHIQLKFQSSSIPQNMGRSQCLLIHIYNIVNHAKDSCICA